MSSSGRRRLTSNARLTSSSSHAPNSTEDNRPNHLTAGSPPTEQRVSQDPEHLRKYHLGDHEGFARFFDDSTTSRPLHPLGP